MVSGPPWKPRSIAKIAFAITQLPNHQIIHLPNSCGSFRKCHADFRGCDVKVKGTFCLERGTAQEERKVLNSAHFAQCKASEWPFQTLRGPVFEPSQSSRCKNRPLSLFAGISK